MLRKTEDGERVWYVQVSVKIDGKDITGPTKTQYMDYLDYQRELRRQVREELKELDRLAPKSE